MFRAFRGALTTMLTQGEDVEAQALQARGWSVSAIARHLGRDRKTIRAYLSGQRSPGVRKPAGPDRFEPFEQYCRIRLTDDPHLRATALLEEVAALGYAGGYSSFTRALRSRGLPPSCPACAAAGTPAEFAIISHPPGEETQWDWVELPDPPAGWDCGRHAHLLVGCLPYSGRWRGVLAAAEDQAHLAAALHKVSVRLGGVTRRWRFDRMSSVCHPESGQVTVSFAAIAKYYGVAVDLCPPRSGWRKGAVEKAVHSAAQRWWRTVPDDLSPARAQARLDAWCQAAGDARTRIRDGRKVTVGELAAGESLRPLPPAPFPAVIEAARVVSAQALVAWNGNFYSVPPGHAGRLVTVRHQLGHAAVDIITPAGITLARHRREPDHAGALVRNEHHVAALEASVLAARAARTDRPCHRKARRPPSPAARAEAARITGTQPGSGATITDFAAWAAAARPLRPQPVPGGTTSRTPEQENKS